MRWLLLFLWISNASADVVRWELEDGKLQDGSQVTGFFDFDTQKGVFFPGLGFDSQAGLLSPGPGDGMFSGLVIAYDWRHLGQRFVAKDEEKGVGGLVMGPVQLRLAPRPTDENWSLILIPGEKVGLQTIVNNIGVEPWGDSKFEDQHFISGFLEATSVVPEPSIVLFLGLALLFWKRHEIVSTLTRLALTGLAVRPTSACRTPHRYYDA